MARVFGKTVKVSDPTPMLRAMFELLSRNETSRLPLSVLEALPR
jgi:hypothetical protein